MWCIQSLMAWIRGLGRTVCRFCWCQLLDLVFQGPWCLDDGSFDWLARSFCSFQEGHCLNHLDLLLWFAKFQLLGSARSPRSDDQQSRAWGIFRTSKRSQSVCCEYYDLMLSPGQFLGPCMPCWNLDRTYHGAPCLMQGWWMRSQLWFFFVSLFHTVLSFTVFSGHPGGSRLSPWEFILIPHWLLVCMGNVHSLIFYTHLLLVAFFLRRGSLMLLSKFISFLPVGPLRSCTPRSSWRGGWSWAGRWRRRHPGLLSSLEFLSVFVASCCRAQLGLTWILQLILGFRSLYLGTFVTSTRVLPVLCRLHLSSDCFCIVVFSSRPRKVSAAGYLEPRLVGEERPFCSLAGRLSTIF